MVSEGWTGFSDLKHLIPHPPPPFKKLNHNITLDWDFKKSKLSLDIKQHPPPPPRPSSSTPLSEEFDK